MRGAFGQPERRSARRAGAAPKVRLLLEEAHQIAAEERCRCLARTSDGRTHVFVEATADCGTDIGILSLRPNRSVRAPQ
jgi:hypothetical protein